MELEFGFIKDGVEYIFGINIFHVGFKIGTGTFCNLVILTGIVAGGS